MTKMPDKLPRYLKEDVKLLFQNMHDIVVPAGTKAKWIEGGQGGWAVEPSAVRLESRTESLFKHDSTYYHIWIADAALTPEEKTFVDVLGRRRVALYVVADGEPTDPEDTAVAGFYRVEVDAEMTPAERCNAALDIFHSKVGVGMLEDFTFSVFTEDGVELDQDGSGDYRFSSRGTFVGPVDELPFPDPTKAQAPVAGR